MRHVEVLIAAKNLGLYAAAYSPGDGVTRYRFFRKPNGYFQADGIYTALGKKDALIFLAGFNMKRRNPSK
jgi:hypothetical protein